MKAREAWILAVACLGSTGFADPPKYYTDYAVASRWAGRVHPGERERGDAFIDSVRRGGMFVGCAAAVAAYSNGSLSKVFHNGVIGATFAEWILDPHRPAYVREGAFSDAIPQTLWGLASFTTGRDTLAPNQLIPDVTGLGIALFNGDLEVPWTSTASSAAFGRNGVGFARLAGYPAFTKMLLGAMSPSGLRSAVESRQKGEEDPENPYLYAPGILRRTALALGTPIGEGLFSLRDPVPAVGTLLPAALTGRRNPFPGYKNIGFGTDTRLLSETPPLKDRRAFRLSFAFANTANNWQVLQGTPGWGRTLINNFRGTRAGDIYDGVDANYSDVRLHRGQHLSGQFERWMRRENFVIDYDVYMQLNDPGYPETTPIESAHRPWTSPRIRVATLRLHSYGTRPEIGEALNQLARRMHMPPGAGYHLPVGDLAWYRSAGRILGKADGPISIDETVDGVAGQTAVGAYTQSRDLRRGLSAADAHVELLRLMREAGVGN